MAYFTDAGRPFLPLMFSVSGDSPDLRSAQPKRGGRLALNHGEVGKIAKNSPAVGTTRSGAAPRIDQEGKEVTMRFKITTRLVTLVLIAGVAGLTLSIGPPVASADSGGNVTFTKWVTNATAFPWDMAGVVGGDVGTGGFVGEVLSVDTIDNGSIKVLHAHYHINGGSQQLTADLLVTQYNQTGMAVFNGVVTDGWLTGAQVHGEYAVLDPCPMPTPGNIGTACFRGVLRVG
jgi:hypothetical protein